MLLLEVRSVTAYFLSLGTYHDDKIRVLTLGKEVVIGGA